MIHTGNYSSVDEKQSKVETVKQRKNRKKKANCRDEKKDVHGLSVKMGMDSKTLREQSSLKRTVGLKRVTEISCILRKHRNYVIICLSFSKKGKRTDAKSHY